ncbi:hypothetical protein [Allostreptomyces psammosilenae]|uniref:Uncharacterized protein n=1 Tax=Allostreptomyces psammosilenae TaxID=1892865 RepID=A0A852ZN11_9ACTN|nr:hypothetical protein [Allostreptomyces psammosilenae]NYI03826.1 hypothetical protein [Allostreptomyces psammosilenae]
MVISLVLAFGGAAPAVAQPPAGAGAVVATHTVSTSADAAEDGDNDGGGGNAGLWGLLGLLGLLGLIPKRSRQSGTTTPGGQGYR